MKIYESKTAPNARRVRMFLAEKGLLNSVEFEEVDLKLGGNITPDFKQKNPIAKIPVLEMEDGSFLSESIAICRYFEALHPEKPLMGSSPQQQAVIEMWQRRCELYFMNSVGMGFQHTSGYFADRMQPVAEWGKVCVESVPKFFSLLDSHLSHSEYIAGDEFSVADITAYVTMDFAKVIKVRPDESLINLKRWYDLISTRESIKA
jgi:glutathione S-transferase